MPKPINLGKKFGDMLRIEPLDADKDHYPDLCIESDDERLANIPDQGVAEIKYRIRSRTHREEKKGKGKDYSCSLRLEILSIDPPASTNKKNGNSDGGARKAMNDYFKDQ